MVMNRSSRQDSMPVGALTWEMALRWLHTYFDAQYRYIHATVLYHMDVRVSEQVRYHLI